MAQDCLVVEITVKNPHDCARSLKFDGSVCGLLSCELRRHLARANIGFDLGQNLLEVYLRLVDDFLGVKHYESFRDDFDQEIVAR